MATAAELVPIEADERFQTLAGDTLALLSHAQGIEIANDAQDAEAKAFLAQLHTASKRWEELRHWFVDPLNRQVKEINARFKAAADPVGEAEGLVKDKVAVYFRVRQEAARKEQERLRRAAEAKAARQAARAAARGEEPPAPTIPLPSVAAPEKTVRTAAGSVTVRRVWRFEVLDETAVPREWLMVNEKAIGAAVKAGIRSIPGVSIYQAEEVAVR